MAAPPLIGRAIPRLRHHLHPHTPLPAAVCLLIRRPCYTTTADDSPSPIRNTPSTPLLRSKRHPPKDPKWEHDPDYRKWKDKEAEIFRDVDPVTLLIKDILHSNRYMDGQQLTSTDEKMVVEKLLAYHPHSEDKIGCGLDSIMVDRHPQYLFKVPVCCENRWCMDRFFLPEMYSSVHQTEIPFLCR